VGLQKEGDGVMEDLSEFMAKVGAEARQQSSTGVDRCVPDVPQEVGVDSVRKIATGAREWANSDDKYWGATQTFESIPSGLYRTGIAPELGPFLTKVPVETDNLIEFPDSASFDIVEEFRTFWEIEDRFRKRGFLHKRGYLLWGPPGSGKTSTLQILMKKLIQDHDGIVLMLDSPTTAQHCFLMLRNIEPKRPVVAVLEDIDALVHTYGENEFLALLDGEAQVDNIVFVATTNYPERLDLRFVNRPSRFDTIKFIGMPSAEARRMYLSTKEPELAPDELDEWVAKSDGFSVAHLKEMIVAVKCFGRPLDEVVDRLDAMAARQPKSEDNPELGARIGMLAQVR
jgi:energy-coupling factor transporter ATP-binding protein EcfA2